MSDKILDLKNKKVISDNKSEENSSTKEKKSVSEELFNNMREKFLENLSEDDKEAYQKFGEKFHKSFNVMTGETIDLSNISMEEALSYVVESLKSGLHPKYLDENERAMMQAGYGEEWFKKWGCDSLD